MKFGIDILHLNKNINELNLDKHNYKNDKII